MSHQSSQSDSAASSNNEVENIRRSDLTTRENEFLGKGLQSVSLKQKPNNYYLDPKPDGFPAEAAYLIEVLNNHPLHYALTATKQVPESHATQFLLSSYVCTLDDTGLTVVGYVTNVNQEPVLTLSLNVNDLRTALHLPTLEDLQLSVYDSTPSDEELLEFLAFISYTSDEDHVLNKRGDFRRMGLSPLWNTLFSILNCCLTRKVGSHDQTSHPILSILYEIYFNLKLDYAELIFEDFVSHIRKKRTSQTS